MIRDYFRTLEICIHGDYVAFWGSPFSNFYPCHFTLDGKEWKTSEHYFMSCKAKYFGDDEAYERILKAKRPEEAKGIGREVKGFDPDKWMEVCKDVMYKAVYAKFSQDPELRDYILSDIFEGKHFVEGSPFDGIWGVKLKWKDKAIADKNNWKGLNYLGEVLDQVREDLKKER